MSPRPAVRPLDPLVYALTTVSNAGAERAVQLGAVTSISGSNVGVRFDGEGAPSPRLYRRLSSYTPTVGDRVLLLKVGRTWVVLGKLA